MAFVSKYRLSCRPRPEQAVVFMSRSGLGRGLGNLLSEQERRGTSTPGPGVIRLMCLTIAAKTDPVRPLPTTPADIRRTHLASTAIHGLWIADASLSVIALWLGGFSPMAGQPAALWLGAGLVVIGGFLGLVAAGAFGRR